MSSKRTLLYVARKHLNNEGVNDVKKLLNSDRVESARAYVFGAVQVLWENKILSQEEAEEAFKNLQINADDITEYEKRTLN